MAPRRRRHVAAAAALVAAAVSLSSCGISLQTLPLLGVSTSRTYPVRAVVANALNLDVGAPVRLSAATVGTVSAVTVAHGDALVTMRVHDNVHLPADTDAAVRFVTPLGSEYVQLAVPPRGGSGRLRAGSTIPLARTSAAPTVNDTLAAAGTLLFGSGLGQVETLTEELNQVLGGNQPQIRQLLAELDTAVGSLAAHRGAIDQALGSLAQLSAQLDAGRSAITAALASLPAAAGTLAADNAQLAGLLQGVDQLAPQVVTLAQQSGTTITADSQQLAPVAAQLQALDGQLGTDLSTLQRFSTGTTRAIPGDYLQGDLRIYLVNQPLHIQVPPVSPLLQGGPAALVEAALQALTTSSPTPGPPAGAPGGPPATPLTGRVRGLTSITALLQGALQGALS